MEEKDEATSTVVAAEVATATEPDPAPLPPVTSAADWRRKARACFLVPLPSGTVVKAQFPDWNRLILEGAIKQEQLLEIRGNDEFSEARYQRMYEIACAMAPHIVVEPVVVRSNGHAPEDDAEFISVDQIPERDVTTLLYWATGVRQLPNVHETTR